MEDHGKQIRAENHALHTRSMEHPEDGALAKPATYTPEPWKAEMAPNGFAESGWTAFICGNYDKTGRFGDQLASVTTKFSGENGRAIAQEEWAANARLMAAAPDLFAALERLGAKQFDGSWHTVTCYPNYLGPGSICLSQCVQARAAIGKARGQ